GVVQAEGLRRRLYGSLFGGSRGHCDPRGSFGAAAALRGGARESTARDGAPDVFQRPLLAKPLAASLFSSPAERTERPRFQGLCQSGRRDSDPRPSAWKADALANRATPATASEDSAA